jgi:hypothetical protein
MNISLPDALKKKMDEMKGVNWSYVAQRAFIQEIRELSFENTSCRAVAGLGKSGRVAASRRETSQGYGKRKS